MSRNPNDPTRRSLEPLAHLGQTAPVAAPNAASPATPFDAARAAAPKVIQYASIPPDCVLSLVWVAPAIGPRLRRQPAWRALLDAAEQEADPELDEETHAERDSFLVLARAEAVAVDELKSLLSRAVRPDGKLVPPFAAISGRIFFPFDPTKRLAVTNAMLEPFGRRSPELKETLDAIHPFLGRPEAAIGGAASLANQLVSEARAKVRGLPEGHIERAIERALLEERAYQRRDLLGAEHVRGILRGIQQPVVVYLPLEAARRMPLFSEVDVRVLAEIHPPVDEGDPGPVSLFVRAIARGVAA